MALVLLGLAVVVLPRQRARARPRPGQVLVGPARHDYVSGVIALIGRVFAEYGFVWDPAAEVPDLLDFQEHYVAPRGAFFIVRRGDRIVGSVGIERIDGDTAELHRLYLDPDLRGRGLGQTLVGEVITWCRARAVSRLVLWSDTRFEQAHRLYTRMGFHQSGERVLPGDVNRTREYRFERPV
jgi:GNAT superfamily N-acetyltransferase